MVTTSVSDEDSTVVRISLVLDDVNAMKAAEDSAIGFHDALFSAAGGFMTDMSGVSAKPLTNGVAAEASLMTVNRHK